MHDVVQWKRRSIATLVVNQSLAWNDTVDIVVDVVGMDGVPVDWPTVERTVQVGRWTSPLPITKSPPHHGPGPEHRERRCSAAFFEFDGHGWQERVGESLTAWELGDGRR